MVANYYSLCITEKILPFSNLQILQIPLVCVRSVEWHLIIIRSLSHQPLGEQNWVSAHSYEEALEKGSQKYDLAKDQLSLQQGL